MILFWIPKGRVITVHEMGILVHLIDQVERVVDREQVGRIVKLVLQIGELSSVVPRYMHYYYPAAIKGTILQGAELEIEEIPGVGRCHDCGQEFSVVQYRGRCPGCQSYEYKLLSGRELLIKELVVEDDEAPEDEDPAYGGLESEGLADEDRVDAGDADTIYEGRADEAQTQAGRADEVEVKHRCKS